jgi:DivIVA domain-containing protein
MVTIPTRPRVDLTSPRSLSSLELNTVRRGYDRDEVRAVLDQVADELDRLRAENQRLSEQLADARSAPPPELDESTVAALLGEETARVLAAAKEAATLIRAKADDGVERLLRDARDDAARMREEAALDASRARADATADAETEIESAKAEGREMVAEARAVRERMLTDLARRRDAARAQLERLRADRDRLLLSFEDAGRAVDGVLAELRDVLPAPEPLDVETVDEAAAAVAALATGAEPGVVLELVEDVGGDTDSGSVEASSAPAVLELVPDEDEDAVDAKEPAAFHLGEEPEVPEPSLSYAGELDDAPEHRTDVDDLFARIRAAGPADVAADVEREEAADDGDQDAGGEPDLDTVYLAERAEAIESVQASVARHVKRALNDEQNEVLDALRRSASPDDIETLVGVPADHAARYRRALTPDLRTALMAGARSMGGDREPSADTVEALLAEIDVELVTPLRERLAKALEDAAGDPLEASATLRAAYREWRMQRADEAAGHLVLLAHGRGAFDAVAAGTPIRWIVDPEGPLCPDAEDNALGGVIAAGEQFPTGHCHAPAHPGCRCGIVQTQG